MDLNKLLEAIVAHTAALTAHTAALTGAKSTATAGDTKAAGTTTTKAAGTKTTTKPKGHTKEEMTTALTELKEGFGAEEAKTIIKDVGGVDKLGQVTDDKFDAVCKAAVARKAELENGGGAGEPEDDGL